MRCAIYARVSTADQDCSLQTSALREYIAARGWEPAGEYVDTGWSGTKTSRPAFDRMMDDARQRKFDCIVAWKLDRLGRSLSHILVTIQALRGMGVRFMTTTQPIDTDENNPMAKFMLQIMGAIAELEREMIKERCRAGQMLYQQSMAEGKPRPSRSGKGLPLGRPKKIFRRDLAVEMRAGGASWREIARELGVAVTTVREACDVE